MSSKQNKGEDFCLQTTGSSGSLWFNFKWK